jgi:CHAT domain-containing protein
MRSLKLINNKIGWGWMALTQSIALLLCLSFFPIKAQTIASQERDRQNILIEVNRSQDLLERGQLLYNSQQYSAAANVLEEAILEYKKNGDKLKQAVALSNLALVRLELGYWQPARESLNSSLKILEEFTPASSLSVLAKTLDVRGKLELDTGQPQIALDNWEKSTKIYHQLGDEVGEIKSILNQARALQNLGFYKRALHLIQDLNEKIAGKTDNINKVIALKYLGDALILVGDLEESSQVLLNSLNLANKLNALPEIASINFSLANNYRAQNNLDRAWKYYQNTVNLSTNTKTKLKAEINLFSLAIASGCFHNKSTSNFICQKNNWEINHYQNLNNRLDLLPPSRETIYTKINLVEKLIKATEIISEERELNKIFKLALQQSRNLQDNRAESYTLGINGYFLEQKKNFTAAEKLTQQALTLAEKIDANDIAYRWQWQLGRVYKAQGKIEEAISSYDRAIINLKSLRNDLVSVNRDVQFNFRDSVEPVYRQAVELIFSRANLSDRDLNKARNLIESLQLAELDNFFREACLNSQTVIIDDIVDRENPNTAILYPIILPERLQVIVKIPQQPLRYHTIERQGVEVEAIVSQLQAAITEPDRQKETRLLSQQLYQWLIAPIEKELQTSGVNTLVFISDGSLRNIPMASLNDGKQYLIEKYAIALSPGLQLFSAQKLSQTQLSTLAAGLSQPPKEYSQFPPLPQVRAELNLITQAGASTTKLVDDKFTSQTLTETLQQFPFQIVHLATHGQFSSQAKDTFILAADGAIDVNRLDKLLRNKELGNEEAIELLVLSACETAAGDNRAALGLAGIAIKAGAKSTLASLWRIDDRSTAIFIGEFYRILLTEKVTKAEALRRAQLSLIKKYPNYNRPVYWAPYVLIGNWI